MGDLRRLGGSQLVPLPAVVGEHKARHAHKRGVGAHRVPRRRGVAQLQRDAREHGKVDRPQRHGVAGHGERGRPVDGHEARHGAQALHDLPVRRGTAVLEVVGAAQGDGVAVGDSRSAGRHLRRRTVQREVEGGAGLDDVEALALSHNGERGVVSKEDTGVIVPNHVEHGACARECVLFRFVGVHRDADVRPPCKRVRLFRVHGDEGGLEVGT